MVRRGSRVRVPTSAWLENRIAKGVLLTPGGLELLPVGACAELAEDDECDTVVR